MSGLETTIYPYIPEDLITHGSIYTAGAEQSVDRVAVYPDRGQLWQLTISPFLTKIGQASIANAIALGQKVNLTEMAIGDGRQSHCSERITN